VLAGGLHAGLPRAKPRCDGPGNFGQTSNNRFHIIDDIPFTTSFKFDFEVWHWAECKVSQSVVAYWYATAEGTDTFAAPKPEELVVPVPPQLKGVEGAIEGETLKVLSSTGGVHTRAGRFWQHLEPFAAALVAECKPGDTLVLGFDVEKAAKHEIFANFTKAIDYGIATFVINGGKASAPVDFFEKKGVKATGELSLGVHELKAGENSLTISITGAHPDAKKSHMVGLDYVRPVAK
jgi:hypothetical protein